MRDQELVNHTLKVLLSEITKGLDTDSMAIFRILVKCVAKYANHIEISPFDLMILVADVAREEFEGEND